MKFGVHVSIAGGIDKAVDRAIESNSDTFQIFTRSSRSWAAKELDNEIVSKFIQKCNTHKFSETVVHMPYLPNLATIEVEKYYLQLVY